MSAAPSQEGPVLGLDYGTRRIGIAVSDAGGRIAFPSGALERKSPAKDLEALGALISERGVSRVVVGLPLHMDGRPGDMAEAARAFARDLAESCGLPVDLLDERWTTKEAERGLREGGRRGKKRKKGEVDAAAAALLLDTYLARRRAGGAA